MKHPLLWLVVVSVLGLGIGGMVFLATAASTSPLTPKDARTPALVSGIGCLAVATGLLVFGVFMFRRRE